MVFLQVCEWYTGCGVVFSSVVPGSASARAVPLYGP